MDDGVAVGSEIGGVYGVGVIIIRVGVLDLDQDHARGIGGGPVLIEFIRVFLLGDVVPFPVESCAVGGFQVRVGRDFAESTEIIREMAVMDDEGVFRFGVLFPAMRKQDMGAEVHGAAPEFREELALNLDMFDIFRFRRIRDGRDLLIQRDGDHGVL